MSGARKLEMHLESEGMREATIVGPAPCPIERIKTRWRWHLLVKSSKPGTLTRVGRYFAERLNVPSRGDLRVVDRKSTRLNSSHPSISYAVFCLKKKRNRLTR